MCWDLSIFDYIWLITHMIVDHAKFIHTIQPPRIRQSRPLFLVSRPLVYPYSYYCLFFIFHCIICLTALSTIIFGVKTLGKFFWKSWLGQRYIRLMWTSRITRFATFRHIINKFISFLLMKRNINTRKNNKIGLQLTWHNCDFDHPTNQISV